MAFHFVPDGLWDKFNSGSNEEEAFVIFYTRGTTSRQPTGVAAKPLPLPHLSFWPAMWK